VRLDHTLDADPDFARARIAGLQTLACHGRFPPGDVAPALSEGVGALGRGDNIEAAQILEPA
jgi:hypothetical protein